MAQYKALGTDDSVNTCDCCGKSNLKHTVVMESEDGELFHFGSVCATKHSGFSAGQIKSQIQALQEENKRKANKEYNFTKECIAYRAKMLEAHKLSLMGKAFKEYCQAEQQAAHAVVAEIATKYNLDPYEVV